MTEWKVRFVDFPAQFRALEDEIMPAIREVLALGDLIMRQQMLDFEQNLAAYVGTPDAVGVSNCSDGLRLALEALGVGPGDEVITVSHTFLATIGAIHHRGAIPVLVDVGPDHVMDPDAAAAAVTDRTRGIIPVHLNGRVCRMDAIMDLARTHDLFVLEDAAQALGGSYAGVRGGAWGAAGTFSFYPAKMLGAYGDAGAVTVNDAAIAAKLRLLRDHGRATKDSFEGYGWNCRLDNLQAAILDVKLRHYPAVVDRRRELAALYDKSLEGIDEVVRPPAPTADGPHFDVYQNYVVEAQRRDELKAFLAEGGIETLVSLPIPNHKQPTLRLDHFDLPKTEQLSRDQISLPLTTELDDGQIEYVADAIRRFYAA